MKKAESTLRPTGRKEIGKLVKRKQGERKEDFAKLLSTYKLDPETEQILSLDWDTLLGKLQSRELTATKVLEAFIAKALHVSSKCNPVTEFIPQAHVWATELDSLDRVKGPLHGVPFCVKDDTNVVGMDTTHGFGKRLYNPASESAVIVKVLQDLGGIPFCKTNVPQGLSSIGGRNPVFGTTQNAHNEKLTPGGSSAGTGALVGAGGALFGTGSDLCGSLRIPAHFNGVASIKPTEFRLSTKGFIPPITPLPVGLEPVVGIIGQDSNVVSFVFRAMIESGKHFYYDSKIPPVHWNMEMFESKEKLRIGYCTSLPYFPTMGDSGDTILRAKEALESLGHTVIPFKMPDAFDYMLILAKLLIGNSRALKKIWKGEPVSEDAKLVVASARIPNWIQKLAGRIIKTRLIPRIHSKRFGTFLGTSASKSGDVWDAVESKKRLIDDMLTEWDRLELDACLLNTLPFPAPRSEVVSKLNAGVAYTAIWSMVEFPVGVVPFGVESGQKLDEFDHEEDLGFKVAKEVMPDSVGAPIGIQVVGKPFREEVVLRLMKELEPFSTFKRNDAPGFPSTQ